MFFLLATDLLGKSGDWVVCGVANKKEIGQVGTYCWSPRNDALH